MLSSCRSKNWTRSNYSRFNWRFYENSFKKSLRTYLISFQGWVRLLSRDHGSMPHRKCSNAFHWSVGCCKRLHWWEDQKEDLNCRRKIPKRSFGTGWTWESSRILRRYLLMRWVWWLHEELSWTMVRLWNNLTCWNKEEVDWLIRRIKE